MEYKDKIKVYGKSHYVKIPREWLREKEIGKKDTVIMVDAKNKMITIRRMDTKKGFTLKEAIDGVNDAILHTVQLGDEYHAKGENVEEERQTAIRAGLLIAQRMLKKVEVIE